jgi:hypothetical protein
MDFVAWKLSTTEEQHQDQGCFGKEITEIKATTPKTVLRLSPSEAVFWTLETNDSRT